MHFKRVSFSLRYTFLASETGSGGVGHEQERVGKLPSSMAHCSTLKHLQLLRKDLLPLPLLVPCALNPWKRGAPGVDGVTGVEGADGTSWSVSISHHYNSTLQNQTKAKTKTQNKLTRSFEFSLVSLSLRPQTKCGIYSGKMVDLRIREEKERKGVSGWN